MSILVEEFELDDNKKVKSCKKEFYARKNDSPTIDCAERELRKIIYRYKKNKNKNNKKQD